MAGVLVDTHSLVNGQLLIKHNSFTSSGLSLLFIFKLGWLIIGPDRVLFYPFMFLSQQYL